MDVAECFLTALLALVGGPAGPISDKHDHKCPACSEVWSHDRADIKTPEQREAFHTCPKCGFHSDACYRKFRPAQAP